MTTIRLLDPEAATGHAKAIFDAVLRREQRVFGATSVSNIWRCMGITLTPPGARKSR